ncbi:MAG: tetratricopeptide repeat protein, partial [Gemmataceae bacterium]
HDPARADAYLLRGTARAAHGQSDLALADFAQSIELDPENSETFIARSELYTDLEQPDLAQLDMERALQLLTEMAGATVERAEAAAGFGVAGLLYMQGKQALSNGDYAEAAEHFEAALERAPNELPPRLGRMMTAYLLEDWTTAIDQATVVLEQDAENSSARQLRGLAYAELGEIAAAVADLDAYVAANADVPKPYQLRASVRSKFGLHAEALPDYLKALELDPEDAVSFNGLAWVFATVAELRQPSSAVECATRANELTEFENPDYLDTLAAAHASGGDFARAVQVMDKALELAPDRESFRLNRGAYAQGQLPAYD